jgi:hypothetical protein
MSAAERRYCASMLEKGSRYRQLFSAINKLKQWDENHLRQCLDMDKKPGDFAVLKNQLFDRLLAALQQFDRHSNPIQRLYHHIHGCQVLIRMGLFAKADKELAAVRKEAYKWKDPLGILMIQQLQMQLWARIYFRELSENKIDEWQIENLKITHELTENTRYKYLSSKLSRLQYASGVRGRELAQKMQPLLAIPEFVREPESVGAKLDFLQAHALFDFTRGEVESARKYNRRFLELLNEDHSLREIHADRYFSVFNNFLIDCLLQRDFETMLSGLERLRKLPAEPGFRHLSNIEANVFRLSMLLELNYLLGQGQFKKAAALSEPLLQGLEIHGDRIVKANRITLLYLMAYAVFANGDPSSALDYLISLQSEKAGTAALQLQRAARLLQMICHFECGDLSLVESLILSARREDKEKTAPAILKETWSFLLSASRKQLKWDNYLKKLEALVEEAGSPELLNLFQLQIWAYARQNKTSFAASWKKFQTSP